MNNTTELHDRAMELYEAALVARHRGDELRTRDLLHKALELETAAADSVAADTSLEPTRSVLHRSAASIALQAGEHATAKRYVERGLDGRPPAEIRGELEKLYSLVITLQAERVDYRLKAPRGLTPVQETIRRFTRTAPVDIFGLAEALGLLVRTVDLGENSGAIFPDSRSGSPSGFVIHVNTNHPKVRQRYTVAHEIAHFLRHRDRIGNRLVDDRMYRSGIGDTREFEADRLAAQLLIPGLLLGEMQNAGIKTPRELAMKFDVSLPAMERRLGIKKK